MCMHMIMRFRSSHSALCQTLLEFVGWQASFTPKLQEAGFPILSIILQQDLKVQLLQRRGTRGNYGNDM